MYPRHTIKTDTPIQIRGGPQDGAFVHPVGGELSHPLFLGPKWLGDGYSAWGREASERFPARHLFNQGANVFDFDGWGE